MRTWISPGIALGLLLATSAASAAPPKLVCWTDDKGQRSCGDRLPPQYAAGAHQQLDKQGRVIGKQSAQKSAAEVAEEERKAKAAEVEEERRAKQARYDQFLLQTYNSGKELEESRDSRLRAINGQLAMNEKSIADAEKAVAGFQKQVDDAKAGGKEPPAPLLKQLKTFQKSLDDSREAREKNLAEQQKIKTKFAIDIDRLEKLRSHQIEVGAPVTPPPETPAPSAAPAPAPAPAAAPAAPPSPPAAK